jgi:hypothetical protein
VQGEAERVGLLSKGTSYKTGKQKDKETKKQKHQKITVLFGLSSHLLQLIFYK